MQRKKRPSAQREKDAQNSAHAVFPLKTIEKKNTSLWKKCFGGHTATERGAEGLTGAREAGLKGWLVLAEEEGVGG